MHLCVCMIYALWGKELICEIADALRESRWETSMFAGSGSLQSNDVVGLE